MPEVVIFFFYLSFMLFQLFLSHLLLLLLIRMNDEQHVELTSYQTNQSFQELEMSTNSFSFDKMKNSYRSRCIANC